MNNSFEIKSKSRAYVIPFVIMLRLSPLRKDEPMPLDSSIGESIAIETKKIQNVGDFNVLPFETALSRFKVCISDLR